MTTQRVFQFALVLRLFSDGELLDFEESESKVWANLSLVAEPLCSDEMSMPGASKRPDL